MGGGRALVAAPPDGPPSDQVLRGTRSKPLGFVPCDERKSIRWDWDEVSSVPIVASGRMVGSNDLVMVVSGFFSFSAPCPLRTTTESASDVPFLVLVADVAN